MAIKIVETKAHQYLPEYHVGKATETCIYPGIIVCFAIAGWTPTGMLCAHLSTKTTKKDMSDIFAAFRDKGGKDVMYWHVVGPFTQHFGVKAALWQSVGDIKKTFESEFKNKAAAHWVLDATAERNTKRMYEGIDQPMTFRSIDIRAEHRAFKSNIWFSFKEGDRKVTEWNRFNLAKFVRI